MLKLGKQMGARSKVDRAPYTITLPYEGNATLSRFQLPDKSGEYGGKSKGITGYLIVYTFLIKFAAAALASTWAAFLQPGMTQDTAGFFRHQASAHWPIEIPEGISV
jgi:hypothetical protein